MSETVPMEGTAYEFRRRLATILAEGELLLEGERGELTDDQRRAIEAVVAEGHLMTGLVADRLETAGDDGLDEDEGIALDPEPPRSVAVATPHATFGGAVVAELERSGHEATLVGSTPDDALSAGAEHAVIDLSAIDPAAGFDGLAREGVSPVSIVAGEDATKPVIGLSGLLARDAPSEVVERVLDDHLDEGESVLVVGEGPEPGALDGIAPVERADVGSAVERTHTAGVGCVLLGRDALAERGWSLLWELRRPDGRTVPSVILTADCETDWTPTVGGRLAPGRPLTAVSLASLLMLDLRNHD